ncbi:THUMP domain-containing class I SAM-dependent RNA methyltransferase [Carboxylicivirga sp. N1Y90]|uniref:THUMP domain-containing class I SAM-dependent RNA methyltransferase n=1 Tax=Carboxylicivirga fragile TaxID=3417571 RepID=UPI003D34AD5D|nr:RNA methyltransferase [Marinilabiliaceae bacterium N1Y90]
MEKFEIIATTLFGLEEILAGELKDLGATDIELLNRAVKFEGDKALLYKCNLHLRTALKVLKPFAKFMVHTDNDLYRKIKKIDWDQHLSVSGTLAIEATVSGEQFTHSQFVALRCKDAIVDKFRDKYEERPSVDLDNPDLRLNVHITDLNCSLSLDSSSTSLGKRGYRQAQSLAPMSEVLAAGIIALSGWDKKRDFYDPMCGSGTFSIEAALMAANIAPGQSRSFGFERWKDFDANLWSSLKREAKEKEVSPTGKFLGSDLDTRAVEISKSNAANAGVDHLIEFKQMDFLKSDLHFNNGFVFLNPPYGERLKEVDEIIPFYKEIGTQLKHHYEGCEAWIISSNIEALKFIGLRPSRKIRLFNGPLDCKLHKYELFKGKKGYQAKKN